MTNYCPAMRSSYFQVKDPAAFSVHVHTTCTIDLESKTIRMDYSHEYA